MGKSDPYVFEWYKQNLPHHEPKKIAILGSTSESFVRQKYPHSEIDLFDIQLKNWEINQKWNIDEDAYDLIVCTRCAYFSEDPNLFLTRCMTLLKVGGFVFVDWGLGDHWRFDNFKLGWKKDEEHEYSVYASQKYYLYSCLWNTSWEENPTVKEFKINTQKFGYSDKDILCYLRNEVPSLVEDFPSTEKVEFLTLWPDNPQLYILTIFKKKL